MEHFTCTLRAKLARPSMFLTGGSKRMMHLSKDDHESVARVKEVLSAEAARCNSHLGTVWEGLIASLDRRLPREVVELRLLHGDDSAHDEHCVRCMRSAPAHESEEYWESDGGDGMICPGCLTTEERQDMAEDMEDMENLLKGEGGHP